MNSYQDSRWLQRYQNYQRALSHLDAALLSTEGKDVTDWSDLEKQGTIKCFEMAFELAWKTLQDYLAEQGYDIGKGPKATIQQAFKDNLVVDGNAWIRMLDSRNEAAHTYDEAVADEIIQAIVGGYYALFDQLDRTLARLKNAL
jgi:nucleotidyltransferase substrate binding protein (TIGR01987 family)